jgi:NAD(P)-dependent dehydrogenase (short-subunit alcohol dehydrogenase family)
MDDITSQFRLDGKIALITGATRGLGKEIAFGFARAGADVIISSRKADACERVAAEIAEHTGRRCDALHERVLRTVGPIDVLVNNAGMSPLYDDVRSVTEELWNKVLGVNLAGPFRLSALFGSDMRTRGGAIINISSGAALQATASTIPYAAAKAGVHALTTGFADALGPEVRVNTIVCGRFLTDVSKAWDLDALQADLERFQPLRRAARPSEIVGTALYLASEASSFTTGAMVRVDGGAAL